MALILYGGSISPFVRKVCLVLAEKGLDFTHEYINPFAPPPGFLEISPLKRIPVLRDTDLPEPNTIADSTVIVDYLEQKFPKPPLYPREAFPRARALWFEEYADTALALAIGPGLYFERVVKRLLRRETDEAVVAATLKEKVPPVFDYLEKEAGSKSFLAGNAFSIADIAVGVQFAGFAHAGETIDAARWPNLARYTAALLARPTFKAQFDEVQATIKRLTAG